MNAASIDAVVARLRSGKFDTPNELAAAIAAALAGVAKNQMSKRGLHANNIVDANGGTQLSVSDQSAARQSVSTQPPQTMVLSNPGGAVSTRQQSLVDILTKVVPAKVISVDGTGPGSTVTVVVLGDKPKLTTDLLTGQNVPGDPLLALDDDIADITGTTYTLGISGLPFSGTGDDDTGTKVPEVGQTIQVTIVDQQQKQTIWHTINGINKPTVVNYPQKSAVTQAAILNGLCCKEPAGSGGGGS